jgi:hypothetical protein
LQESAFFSWSGPSEFPGTTHSNILVFQAAKDVSTSREVLTDLFDRIGNFLLRLEIYTGVRPTAAMTDIIVQIMVEVLTILAVATKEVERGRLSELNQSYIYHFFPHTLFRKVLQEAHGGHGG